MNTTRAITREEVNLNSVLDQPRERWLETCYVAEGPLYFAVLALNIASPTKWKAIRVKILQRLLLTAHARSVSFRYLDLFYHTLLSLEACFLLYFIIIELSQFENFSSFKNHSERLRHNSI